MTGLLVLLVAGLFVWLLVLASNLSGVRLRLTRANAETANATRHAHAAEQRATGAEQRAHAAEQRAVGAEQRAHAADQRAVAAEQRARSAEQRVAFLSKYERIVDAEAAAVQIRAQAQYAATQLEGAARHHADGLVMQARKEADRLTADAKRVVDEAARLEATVRALRNVVDGYGDAYIVPTTGLLDELAEHFGYAEAGEKLKAARKRSQSMAKSGAAGDSDYVEPARRETAIRFVVDAFNGKVDTILADTKEDNYGTLAQKIRDAFALVNQNGAAFRNTRITPSYLECRLEELKWAVIAFELREREREEQRAMKERIRDEERAQKEFERAQKEALKEEELLRKAMEKAKREAEASSEADRARFEQQLRDLEAKLQAAEEKNKRAISMAQQTKAGHVYVISNVGSFGEHVYKIGMTRRLDPNERVRELGDASVPFEFDVHALIRAEDAPALECALHRKFVTQQVNKVNPRKEFFRVKLEEIRAEIERLGIPVAWTMTAAAREFHESLAMEKQIAGGELGAEKWREAQVRAIESQPPTREMAEA